MSIILVQRNRYYSYVIGVSVYGLEITVVSAQKYRNTAVRIAFLVLPAFVLAAILLHDAVPGTRASAAANKPYGLTERVAPSGINLPKDMPVLGDWKVADAFPNLTFEAPMWLTYPQNDDRFLYVVERHGKVHRFEDRPDADSKTLFLDISEILGEVTDEEGFAAMCFHPDFGGADGEHNYVYLTHTAHVGGKRYDRLTRFTVPDPADPIADPASEFVMIDQLDENPWHNLGAVGFGQDGFLYMTIGDEGEGRDKLKNGQKITKDLFSGMLRIDVDEQGGDISHAPKRQPRTGKTQGYFIPNDNPFVGIPDALEEFYAIGMRNAWRWSWDRQTGKIWAGVVGQTQREIVIHITKGSNHGWSYREGTRIAGMTHWAGKKPDPFYGEDVAPFYEYVRGAVIGGYVYRGKQFPELYGKYIFGDNRKSRVFEMTFDEDGVESVEELIDLQGASYLGLVSFNETREGELLFLISNQKGQDKGRILRLERTDWENGPTLPQMLSKTGLFEDLASLKPQPAFIPYEPNSPFWSDRADKSRWIAVPGDGSSADPTTDRVTFTETGDWTFPNGTVFVKHFDLNTDLSNPDQRIRLETRVLVKTNLGAFYAATYRWNQEQTDAELILKETIEELPIIQEDGTPGTQQWLFPSPSQCMECHNVDAPVLGVSTAQLNGEYDYGQGKKDNQIRTWSHLNLFDEPIEESKLQEMDALVHVDATDADINERFKSYLDSNCSQCHRPNTWMGNHYFDARYETPLEESGVLDPALWTSIQERIGSAREHERMPPVGRFLVDQNAVAMMNQWTRSLTPGWVVMMLMLIGLAVPAMMWVFVPRTVPVKDDVNSSTGGGGAMLSSWPIRLFAALLFAWSVTMIFAARADALLGWFKQLPLAWVAAGVVCGAGTLILLAPPTIKRLGHAGIARLHILMAVRLAGVLYFAVHAWQLIPDQWLVFGWMDIAFGVLAIITAAVIGRQPARGGLCLAAIFNLIAILAYGAYGLILLRTHPVEPTFHYPLVMVLVIYIPVCYLLHVMGLLAALMRLRQNRCTS